MAAKRRNALGKGLSALLDDNEVAKKENTSSVNPAIFNEISISEIETNPYQPRDFFDEEALNELAESIKVQGIIQPITVRRLSNNEYQLISGERRFQASKIAGLDKIPAYIRKADDQQMLEMGLIENIQREDLNAIEIALSYQRLLEEIGLKQEDLGKRVGKNRATVNNYLRLLKLPPAIQIALQQQKISMGHARALITVDSIDTQLAIFERILKEDLSVRKVEGLVRDYQPKEKKEKVNTALSPEFKGLQDKLSSHFGTKIHLNKDLKNKGQIKIPFASLEDLNRLLDILDI